MDRRRFLAFAGVAAFAGQTAGRESRRTEHFGQNQDEPTTVGSESEVMEYSGSGSSVIRDVEIDGGLTVVTVTHDGSGFFAVDLVPLAGEYDVSVAYGIGGYQGTSAELVDAGTYLIDIEADGDWELQVTQPRPTSGSSLPTTIRDDVPNVFGPFEFSGVHIATATHNGEGLFGVDVLPPQGPYGEYIFIETGQFEGEATFRFEGVGFVAVEADGTYKMTIE